MPGQPFLRASLASALAGAFPGFPCVIRGSKHQHPLKLSGFASVGPSWALTVTVLAGGAQRPRLLASALALVQFRPSCAAFHGLSRCATSPALMSVHVRPIKADENEEKTMTPIDFTLLIDALARLAVALATFVTAYRRRRR
jgi:hypothetical protein